MFNIDEQIKIKQQPIGWKTFWRKNYSTFDDNLNNVFREPEYTPFKNKLIYLSLLTVMHHTVLFSLEIFNLSKTLFIFDRVIMSSIFTITLCILFSYLFKTNER